MARILLFLLIVAFQWRQTVSFCSLDVARCSPRRTATLSSASRLLMSSNNNNNDPEKTSARDLGFDSPAPPPSSEPQKVRVDLVDDVDSVSLTAIGFGLIAFNFLVLANLGDGGIAGLVATIINTLRD